MQTKRNMYRYSKEKSKKCFSHMTRNFLSFNDYKFDVLLLNYILLISYVIISDRVYYSKVLDDKTFLSSASP